MNKQKAYWMLLGFLFCIGCGTIMGANWITSTSESSANIATSSDGKYVYIVGNKTDSFFRSENHGKTFERIEISKE